MWRAEIFGCVWVGLGMHGNDGTFHMIPHMLFQRRGADNWSPQWREASHSHPSIDALTAGRLHDPRTAGLMIEVLKSDKKAWKYERRLIAVGSPVRLTFGHYPSHTVAAARTWAQALNDQIEAGVDPREARRAAKARASMTLARAHELYMIAVHEGRASRAKRKNKPRTISDKQEIYDCEIPENLRKKSIYEVTEKELIDLVTRKGRTAKCGPIA